MDLAGFVLLLFAQSQDLSLRFRQISESVRWTDLSAVPVYRPKHENRLFAGQAAECPPRRHFYGRHYNITHTHSIRRVNIMFCYYYCCAVYYFGR